MSAPTAIMRDLAEHGCDCKPTIEADEDGFWAAWHKRGCGCGRQATFFPPIQVDDDLVWLTIPWGVRVERP